MTTQEQFESLMEKMELTKKSKKVDLSTEEDLSIAIMNLISLEEHFFFSGEKTNKTEYFDLLDETRAIRKNLLVKIMDKNEGESWCIAKHLLATTMRLIEVGTKLHQDKKTAEAKEIFDHAYKLYSMFWALRLKIINIPDIKKQADNEQPWTLKDIVNKLVNCCDE